MKNILIIDVDSERSPQILFAKTSEELLPKNEQEGRVTIVNDLKTLTHGLGSFINIAANNGLGTQQELFDEAVNLISQYISNNKKDEKSNQEEPTTTT